MGITGSTNYYAQLADPVAHVRFPQLFQPVLDRLGYDIAVTPMHVRPEGLADVVNAMRAWENLTGIGVTMPHKEAILPLLDGLTREASLVGAVNAVRREPDGRLIGTMIDGLGFVQGLRDCDCDPEGMKALVVGAGGTARAIAFALADAGATELTIANRTAAKADELATAVQNSFPQVTVRSGPADATGRDLIVNATKLGMAPDDPLPVDPDAIAPGAVVAEVVMVPVETSLLTAAAERGATTIGGRDMLDTQIPLVLDFLDLDRILGCSAEL